MMAKFSMEKVTAPFQSKAAFLKFIRTDEDGVISTPWANKDLEPTPPEKRHWKWYNLPFYWLTTAFGTAGWNLAASLIAIGLVSYIVPRRRGLLLSTASRGRC
jgi:NCS1 family nucleobase:cation symporter-1